MGSNNSDTPSSNATPGQKPAVWEFALGETIILTALTAVLFLWGKIYFNTLAAKLGFEAAMFDIPFYEVLVSSWSKAFVIMLGVLAFVSLQSMSGIFQLLLFIVIVVPFRLLRSLIPATLKRRASHLIERIRPTVESGQRHIPRFIIEEINRTDEAALFRVAKAVVVILAIGFGIETASSEAKEAVTNYQNATSVRPITVYCEDGQRFDGILVDAIGDGIVIDVDSSPGDRMLLRRGDVKRIIRHPNRPRKDAEKSNDNASPASITKN